MPTTVVIPIKSFRTGKQRLSSVLSPDARAALIKSLADHVASTVAEADLLPLIVTADSDVAAWAIGQGFPSIPDPGEGLNVAARVGVVWATQTRGSWLVTHGDLPMLDVADLNALESVLAAGANPIAPSADGGTSAVGGVAEAPFYFGEGSFQRHLMAAPRPHVVFRPGLALDIDSPLDLEAALRHPRGAWIGDVL